MTAAPAGGAIETAVTSLASAHSPLTHITATATRFEPRGSLAIAPKRTS